MAGGIDVKSVEKAEGTHREYKTPSQRNKKDPRPPVLVAEMASLNLGQDPRGEDDPNGLTVVEKPAPG
eukprot:5095774-Prorocentrum_lima.AAC.1